MKASTQAEGRKAWEAYGNFLDQALSHGQHGQRDIWGNAHATFAEYGVAMGQLPADQVASLVAALQRCSIEPIGQAASHPQFDETVLPQDVIDNLNTGTDFYGLSAEALWHVADMLDYLRDQFAAFFGSPWRVLGARGYKLTANSVSAGPNEWHLDGLPLCLCKVMLFLTPLDVQRGTIQIRLANGQEMTLEQPAPTWLLFRPSELSHRGIPPLSESAERFTVEATLVSSVAFDQMPVFAGNNARHPYYPWYRAGFNGG